MTFDDKKNFAITTIVSPPSPSTSGGNFVISSGDVGLFPVPPFYGVVKPQFEQPVHSNAEIVRVTAVSGDTFFVTRSQENTSPRAIVSGDQFYASPTAQTFKDLEKKFTYDCIVDASGTGDYSRIEDAVNAGKKSIFVRAGTYTLTSNVTLTSNNLFITGDGDSTVLNLNGNNCVITSTRFVFRNLKVSCVGSSCFYPQSSADGLIENCLFEFDSAINAPNGAINIFNSQRICFRSCKFIELFGKNYTSSRLRFGAADGLIENCYFDVYSQRASNSISPVPTISAGFSTSFNNNVFSWRTTTGTAGAYVLGITGNGINITNNKFVNVSGAAPVNLSAILLITGSGSINITGNIFSNFLGASAIKLGDNQSYGEIIVQTSAFNCSIHNNYFSQGLYGVSIWYQSYGNIIENNIFSTNTSGGAGIYIANSSASPNTITLNNFANNDYGIDVGPGTRLYGWNISSNRATAMWGFLQNQEMRLFQYTNSSWPGTLVQNNQYRQDHTWSTPNADILWIPAINNSGGTLNDGSVVVLSSNLGDRQITTTTKSGASNVIGVWNGGSNGGWWTGSGTGNNQNGWVQVKGKAVNCKANGTIDISVGDYLSTSTVAGVAKKAEWGEWVFAQALEAYTSNDSNGVIDIILIDKFCLTQPNVTITVDDDYDITYAESVIMVDGDAGAVTVTLPTAIGNKNAKFVVKKMADSSVITIDTTSSQTIDGEASYDLTTAYESVTLMSDGSNWIVI